MNSKYYDSSQLQLSQETQQQQRLAKILILRNMINTLVVCFLAFLLVGCCGYSTNWRSRRNSLSMKVENDAFAKANREMRKAGADDRTVELRM